MSETNPQIQEDQTPSRINARQNKQTKNNKTIELELQDSLCLAVNIATHT